MKRGQVVRSGKSALVSGDVIVAGDLLLQELPGGSLLVHESNSPAGSLIQQMGELTEAERKSMADRLMRIALAVAPEPAGAGKPEVQDVQKPAELPSPPDQSAGEGAPAADALAEGDADGTRERKKKKKKKRKTRSASSPAPADAEDEGDEL